MKKKKVKNRLIILLIILTLIGISYFTYMKIDNDGLNNRLAQGLNLQTNDFEKVEDILSGQLEDNNNFNNTINVEETLKMNMLLLMIILKIWKKKIKMKLQKEYNHILMIKLEKNILLMRILEQKSDEKFDCYICIKNTHDFANEYNYKVRATFRYIPYL